MVLTLVKASQSGRTRSYVRNIAVSASTQEAWVFDVAMKHQTDECLLWPFNLKSRGYGRFSGRRSQATTSHRHVCSLAHGAPPTPKHHAAHSCGVKLCVNPKHLRWATPAENNADKVRHGTVAFGDAHGQTLYSEDNIAKIAAQFYAFVNHISAEFNIPAYHVRRMLRGSRKSLNKQE